MVTSGNVSDFPFEPQNQPPVMYATRPWYWSLRRELWENRFLYIAPVIVAAVVLFATAVSTIGLPRKMRNLAMLEPARQHASIVAPFSMAPAPIMLATFLVAFFYSLEALHGERRDRSILFWKSMPVSDVTTVLSKATVPLLLLPLLAFALSVTAFFLLLFQSTAVLLGSGESPLRLWAEVNFVQEPLVMLYGLTVHSLWFAPIYGWFLLISAWARRAAFLWALLPLLAIATVEKIAFGTTYFMNMVQYRLLGAMREAFTFDPSRQHGALDVVAHLHPLRFLNAPGLWVGLAFAAACLAAAVYLRRYRETI